MNEWMDEQAEILAGRKSGWMNRSVCSCGMYVYTYIHAEHAKTDSLSCQP